MKRDSYSDLLSFLAVARERSFTRAAAQLGVSQSALSHAVRQLETRLDVRLLTRSTRSVAPTEAGERLMQAVAPRFEEIDQEINALGELRGKATGTIRITTTDYALQTVVWPRMTQVLPQYPDLRVETVIDYGLIDIVAQRFDLGIRYGDQVAKDMIAVRLTVPTRITIVAAPSYLQGKTAPQSPQDLARHRCINLWLSSYGGIYAWELERDGQEVQVRVDGQLTFNSILQVVEAATAGFGIAFVPEDLVQAHVEAGRLVYVMEDWFPTWPGLFAYYPSRRQSSMALRVVVDALRYDPSTDRTTSLEKP
jgi:DNA-binding transcriptional LysR family regulator